MIDISKLPKRFLIEVKEFLGDEYNDYAKSSEESWKPGLRANTLRISSEELKAMAPWPMEPVPWTGKGSYYGQKDEAKESARPSKHPVYYYGPCYLQESSAMTPAAIPPMGPGDRVLDLCTAPGGKSTELGARLMDQELLVSNDISYSRARALLKSLGLAGIPNICVTSESPEKLALVWRGFFNKILVDAPCSGEGMFRREEDMVKDWTVHGPSYYAPLQRQIACWAAGMLKPGGMLLYSTCIFPRTEDEENIEYTLDQYPQMELCALDLSRVPGAVNGIGPDGCMRLFPHRVKGEGHLPALLRKKDGETASSRRTREIPGMLKHQEELMGFLESAFVTPDYSRIRIHQNSVYYLLKGLEWDLSLRLLCTGLLLGEMKKGRFEPSQALVMALRTNQSKTTVRLEPEDDRVLYYLKGETLALTREEGLLKGWCLVSMGDHPMGWAKGMGMNLKNKHYPGWYWQ